MKTWRIFLIFLLPMFAEANFICHNECYPFYGEIFGGVNFLQTSKKNDIRLDYDPGYIVGGSIGSRQCYGLRLEGEFAYRRNSLNKAHFFGESYHRSGYFESYSLMGNVLWDIPWRCVVQPYIGGGIGYDFQKTHTHAYGISLNERKKHFAWQFLAGLNYTLPCCLDVFLEYKFHQGGFKHIYCHSLGLGCTYEFCF